MMIVSFLVFLTLVILGHYFAWQLFLQAWPRLIPRRGWLIGSFIFITVFFLSVFMFLRGGENSIISTLYVISAILFGFLTQLMLLGALHWLLITFFRYSWKKESERLSRFQRLSAIVTIVLATCLFLLGSYNAYFPRVKTVTLTGWPESLSGKTFVHLSDMHLGAVYRPQWTAKVVAKVNALHPDFTVISGDLIDGSDRSMGEFAPALRAFEAPTVFTPGNHDYYVPGGVMEKLAGDSDLILLSDAATEVAGVEVVGFNYLARDDSNLRRDIAGLRATADLPRLVLNHVPVDQAEAVDLGAKLMLSGHTHRGQIFPFSLFLNLLYGRFSYGLENTEGMQTYTSAGVGTWGPPLRTLTPGEIILFRFE